MKIYNKRNINHKNTPNQHMLESSSYLKYLKHRCMYNCTCMIRLLNTKYSTIADDEQ